MKRIFEQFWKIYDAPIRTGQMMAAAIGVLIAQCVSGCATMPNVRDLEPRHAVMAADVIFANVAPVCEALSPVPREHPCLLLPRATAEVDRARALLADGNIDAAREAILRAADSIDALAGVLREAP